MLLSSLRLAADDVRIYERSSNLTFLLIPAVVVICLPPKGYEWVAQMDGTRIIL